MFVETYCVRSPPAIDGAKLMPHTKYALTAKYDCEEGYHRAKGFEQITIRCVSDDPEEIPHDWENITATLLCIPGMARHGAILWLCIFFPEII